MHAHQVEVGLEDLIHRSRGGEVPDDLGCVAAQGFGDHGNDRLVPVGKVPVEGALAHRQPGTDLLHGDLTDPPVLQDLPGVGQNPRPALFPSCRCRGFRGHGHAEFSRCNCSFSLLPLRKRGHPGLDVTTGTCSNRTTEVQRDMRQEQGEAGSNRSSHQQELLVLDIKKQEYIVPNRFRLFHWVFYHLTPGKRSEPFCWTRKRNS